MHVMNKISRWAPDAAGKLMPVGSGIGRLVFDPEAPDALRFEGKNETLAIGPVRDVGVQAPYVRITYGKPPDVRDLFFLDFRGGWLQYKYARQAPVLAREIRELVQPVPLPEREAQLYATKREGERAVQGMKTMQAARLKMWISGIVVAFGGIATLVSYSAASAGGRYYVFWGAMVFGALYFIVGWSEYAAGRKMAGGRGLPAATSEKAPKAASVGLDDIAGLAQRGDIDNLVAALGVDELEIRIKAMDALRDLQHPRTLDLLVQRLGHPRWDVRWSAAEALGKLGNPQAIEPLTRCLSDENAMVRGVAEDAIRALQAK